MELGGLQSIASQTVGHNLVIEQQQTLLMAPIKIFELTEPRFCLDSIWHCVLGRWSFPVTGASVQL